MKRLTEFFEEKKGKLSITRLGFFLWTFILGSGWLLMEREISWELIILYAALGGVKLMQRFAENGKE